MADKHKWPINWMQTNIYNDWYQIFILVLPLLSQISRQWQDDESEPELDHQAHPTPLMKASNGIRLAWDVVHGEIGSQCLADTGMHVQ